MQPPQRLTLCGMSPSSFLLTAPLEADPVDRRRRPLFGSGVFGRRRDVAWAVWAGAAVFTTSPLRGLWLGPDLPWWTPFAVWLAVIGAGALVAARWRGHGT